MSDQLTAIRDHVLYAFEGLVEDANERAEGFLVEMEQDLADAWTVPEDRRERYFQRLEYQALGVLEVQRLDAVNTTKRAIARSIVAGIRLALTVLAAA